MLYLEIDFGYRNPFACLWIKSLEKGERVLVLDEYYQSLRTTAENGRAILAHNVAMEYKSITAAYADLAQVQILVVLQGFKALRGNRIILPDGTLNHLAEALLQKEAAGGFMAKMGIKPGDLKK